MSTSDLRASSMRYEKGQTLLRLAFEMQGSAEGVSLQDVMQTYEVSRRTAERMRDAVREIFPQVEEVSLGDGFKRWRIRSTKTISAIPIHTDELAALHAAAELLRRNVREVQADMLESVSAKLRSLLRADELRRMEPDYAALIESEGLVLHPGPRPQIDADILAVLREGIKGCEEIELRYLSRFSGLESRQRVRPYGFLYGSRHYLVATTPTPRPTTSACSVYPTSWRRPSWESSSSDSLDSDSKSMRRAPSASSRKSQSMLSGTYRPTSRRRPGNSCSIRRNSSRSKTTGH